jgi:rSAM/selenodomain-associated transferase 1
MVKAPRAGQVKTRLAAAIGAVEAVRCYRAMLARTVRRLADGRWTTWLAVTPDGAAPRMAARGIAVMAQGPGGLGERMQRVMDEVPPGPVVIVGSDIPGIGRGDVAAAFRALGGHDAVFGPADDGGYWLVGQRRVPRTLQLFEGVRWSSAKTMADTIANLEGRKVSLLRTMEDLDGEADYLRWRRGG